MARIFQDGFEMGRPALHGTTIFGSYLDSLWQFNQNNVSTLRSIGVFSTVKNSGNYSLRFHQTSTSNYLLQVFRNLDDNLIELYDRVEFRADVVRSGYIGDVYHYRDENFDVVASIRIDDNWTLRMFVGDTEVGTIEGAITSTIFHRIETHYLVDGTTGLFEVRVDGNSQFSWEGDTDPLGTGHIRFFCLGKRGLNATTMTFYYDDIAVNDTSGTVNNSWCGKGSILLLKPKGVGHHTDFTPNANDNWQQVNEIPHDGDTSYVYGSAEGDIDTYDLEELVADFGAEVYSSISAIQLCFTGRYEETDAHLAPMLRSGVTDHEGNKKILSGDYYKMFSQIFSISPFTSTQWGLTEVDNLEAGVKHKEHQDD